VALADVTVTPGQPGGGSPGAARFPAAVVVLFLAAAGLIFAFEGPGLWSGSSGGKTALQQLAAGLRSKAQAAVPEGGGGGG
jgi:hypothetical protein